jgi:hypothetical protein
MTTLVRDLSDGDLLATYRAMPTGHIKRAFNAFTLDIADRARAGEELVEFAERRLAVIRRVLQERGEVVPGEGLFPVEAI